MERWISSGEVEVRGTIDAESGELLLAASELKAVRAFAIAREIADIIDQPQQWLDLPNPWMGGHSPRELIGTDREQLVIDVVEGIKHGIPS